MKELIRSLPKTIILEENDDFFSKSKWFEDYLHTRACNPFGARVWVTNYGANEADDLLHDLRKYNPDLYFYIGDPKPSKTYTVEQLTDMGVVGIYRIEPVVKIADIWPLLNNTNIK